jgi:hydroxymethylbilane synthase
MKIRIGTRRSDLARWQANHIASRLREIAPDAEVEIKLFGSTGDRDRTSSFQAIGGLGAFTKETEDALIAGQCDVAVHSLKDLPTVLPDAVVLAAVPEREDPRDVLVGLTLAEIRPGTRIGTSSIRRQAQLIAWNRGIEVVPLRGNVPSRLRKAVRHEGLDGAVLAAAGLSRLEAMPEVADLLAPEAFPYAVGQGALAIEIRRVDERLGEVVGRLQHAPTRAAVDAERTLLRALDAGCSLPVGVVTSVEGKVLTLAATVTAPDGSEQLRATVAGAVADASAIGVDVGKALIAQGAARLLASINVAGKR